MHLTAALIVLTALSACGPERQAADPPPTPPPTYHGPQFLHGTIGSMARLDPVYQPVLVSGYGLVVNLDGTGSPDCPPTLRRWYLEEMAKRGFGQYTTGYADMTPAAVLNSDRTAVVVVEGIVPAGSPKGTRFDLLVTALPQTQTTSLAGGQLYSVDLYPGARDLRPPREMPLATGGPGHVYIDPLGEGSDEPDPSAPTPELLQGRVLGGGVLTDDLPVRLITNRPSYRLTSQIANRINGRWPPESEEDPIANALSDSVIGIRVPDRFRNDPQHLLDMIGHLYLDPRTEFAQAKAREMAQMLQDPAHHERAESVAYVWHGLGNSILPIIRELYDDPATAVRLAALQAGARLDDVRAVEPLFALARGGPAGDRARSARLLGEMLKRQPRLGRVIGMLRDLLDADDVEVRLAAFEALTAVDDASIRRFGFENKLELDRVRCEKPMIYVARRGLPRIIIFDDRLGFNEDLFYAGWDNRFMLRPSESSGRVDLFYQRSGLPEPLRTEIPDNLAYLVGVMAFNPDPTTETPGLDMSYSQIVRVLRGLTQEGMVRAPLVLQPASLQRRIDEGRQQEPQPQRPETSGGGVAADAAAMTDSADKATR